jgi:hypothetical protein
MRLLRYASRVIGAFGGALHRFVDNRAAKLILRGT